MLEPRILHICNFRILLFSFEYLEFYMQVLTDVQKRDGSFELGTIFYTQTVRNKDAYTKGDKRWFICLSDIIKKLEDPRVEKVSKNQTLYFFDDI